MSIYGNNAASLELEDGEIAEAQRAANRKATAQLRGELPIDDFVPGCSSHPALTYDEVLRLNAAHDTASRDGEDGSDV